MSFGDPNNPYGNQQPQPGYGYPQAPGQFGGPGGYPAAPLQMPGGVKAAQVMMWVIAGLQLLGVALLGFGVAAINSVKDDPEAQQIEGFNELMDMGTGVVYALIVVAVLYMAASVAMALQCGKGGNGARIGIIVYASIGLVLSIYPFFPLSLVHLVLLILVIVFVAKRDGAAWFQRPRH
ncbi:hypothetical protein BJP40_03045 [Streptomyces sp. CC53]|uniref:hypothetical protein n=1 Tax=unclassified Streptomyces TaxID=2593676 RepID=UPI0008DD1E17|nr:MULTISPECIES: hypothetical protein [unclassified Streptomyces]OII63208.1 hypothetical protein BJP40_03045 [Streptomyces sp. CC53]